MTPEQGLRKANEDMLETLRQANAAAKGIKPGSDSETPDFVKSMIDMINDEDDMSYVQKGAKRHG